MKSCSFFTLFLLLFFSQLNATEIQEIIKKIEENLNGKTAILQIAMEVKTKRTSRNMKMESYSIGNEKSFIKILHPKKDYGITFLKRDNAMWQYVPRIEKIIKIPASMMLQSWMGSDFSNDDLVRESSISRDYTPQLTGETAKLFHVELLPKENAPVVWGKITMDIDKQYLLPSTAYYYDEENVLIRTLSYEQVKMMGGRHFPTIWTVTPKDEDKKGHSTTIHITRAQFDQEIDSKYFTKRALKRFSR